MTLSEKTSKVIKKHKSKPQMILPIFTFQKSAKLNFTEMTKKSSAGLFKSRDGIWPASNMLHLNATVGADKPM